MLHEMLNLKEDQDSTVQGKDEWKDEKMWRGDARRQVRWRQMGEGFLCPRFLVVDDRQTSQWTVRYPWAQDARRGVHSYVIHLICFVVWNRKPRIWLQFGKWRGDCQEEDFAENDEKHKHSEGAPLSSPKFGCVLN